MYAQMLAFLRIMIIGTRFCKTTVTEACNFSLTMLLSPFVGIMYKIVNVQPAIAKQASDRKVAKE